MRYADAIAYLYALEPRGMSLGLAPIRAALAQRGNPEARLASVHVAGTNGKGSVAAMIASVLQQTGLRVGLFTSPHLHRLVERFRVDGRSMSGSELARRVAALKRWQAQPGAPALTFFELCTLLAFEWFRDQGCDFVVIEVGIGGRLDCTNVITPRVSVITGVALDHQDKLGETLAQIAREKAGIIKPDVPVVVGVREKSALAVIQRRARRLRAPLSRIDRDFRSEATGRGHRVRWDGQAVEARLALRGAYQADNLACAVAALGLLREQGFQISLPALQAGLRRVRWPGRLELIAGAPDVLCDAAHNPEACVALAQYLRTWQGAHTRKVLLFGVLRDKDHAQMLSLLLPSVDEVIFATPSSSRALPSSQLRDRFGAKAFEDVSVALRYAQKRAGERGLIVVAGSIFLMSAVRAALLGIREDPKIAL